VSYYTGGYFPHRYRIGHRISASAVARSGSWPADRGNAGASAARRRPALFESEDAFQCLQKEEVICATIMSPIPAPIRKIVSICPLHADRSEPSARFGHGPLSLREWPFASSLPCPFWNHDPQFGSCSIYPSPLRPSICRCDRRAIKAGTLFGRSPCFSEGCFAARPFAQLLDLIVAWVTVVRLRGFADPMQGTLVEHVIAEEAERLRDQFELSAYLTNAPSSGRTPVSGTVRAFTISPYRTFRRLVYSGLDYVSHLLMLARLRLHDWIAGPVPERPEDRTIREQAERLRRLFPAVDFDDPTPWLNLWR
jgi:hypothetical protein